MGAAGKSHKKEYIYVFIALFVLTAIEVVIPSTSWPQAAKISSLCGLAMLKALIVAWFYMHLNEETRWLKFIAAIPLAAFAYAAMVIAESMFR